MRPKKHPEDEIDLGDLHEIYGEEVFPHRQLLCSSCSGKGTGLLCSACVDHLTEETYEDGRRDGMIDGEAVARAEDREL